MSVESVPVAEQTITGWNLGNGETTRCQYCRAHLGEGDEITVYAYRPVEEQLVSVARVYCAECDRDRIEHPSRGCCEWLAAARLGLTADVAHQSHTLTLLGVSIVDESGPNEGDTL